MKNIFLLSITLLLLPFSSSLAQEQEVDPKANTILQSLAKKTKTFKTIKAEFTMTPTAKDGKADEVQKGSLWVKGGKYKLDIKNQTVFCDSTTTWTYLKDANEVQINTVDPNSDKGGLSPSTIFNFYEKGFKSRYEKEDKIGNVAVDVIDLYPKHPEKEKYHTIKLFIDKAKNETMQVKVMLKDGTIQTYNVDKFTPDTPMPDSEFTFDAKKFPGVDIEDLR